MWHQKMLKVVYFISMWINKDLGRWSEQQNVILRPVNPGCLNADSNHEYITINNIQLLKKITCS